MDRLDYVSMMCNEHAYCLAIEKLLGIEVPIRAQYIRVMFAEITRHPQPPAVAGAHGLDCGAMNMFIYAFREREDLFDMYEAVSGARMHAAYYRPVASTATCPDRCRSTSRRKVRMRRRSPAEREPQGSLLDFIDDFTSASPRTSTSTRTPAHREPHLEAAHGGHRRRVARAGAEPRPHRADAARLGHRLGPAQSTSPYDVYDRMDFDIPVGTNGDTYDRYLVRVEEMRQSNRIIQQCVAWLRANPGPVITDNHKVAPPSRVDMKTNMEELIHHFKLFTEGMHVPEGEATRRSSIRRASSASTSVSDGANKPYRSRSDRPGFAPGGHGRDVARGHMIADAVAIIGTMDIVFGEIDR